MELTEELQKDVRENIISYLPLQNYIKWGPICSSWSIVAKKRHYSSRRLCLPLLVFFDAYKEISTRFFSLSTQRIYHINYSQFELSGRHICGSSHGWLVTVDINLQIHLFDPFSQSQIKLPSLPLSDEDRHELSLRYIDIDQHLLEPSIEKLRDRLVLKAILSADPRKSSDYMVVSSYGMWKIGIWRSGDATWSPLEGEFSYAAADFILHKEKLYVLTNPGHLLSFDLVPHPKFITIYDFMGLINDAKYLVDVKGELLIVERETHYVDDYTQKTTSFVISKFESETFQLRKLKSIGDNILFLGSSYSMALESDGILGLEKDNIYFTDDNYPGIHLNGFEDMGIFNIKDGTIKPFPPNDVYNPTKSPQIWLEAYQWLPNTEGNCRWL